MSVRWSIGWAGWGGCSTTEWSMLTFPGEIEAMESDVERFGPVGWKCYTLGLAGTGVASGWWLDDEAIGVPFVEKAIEVGGAAHLPRAQGDQCDGRHWFASRRRTDRRRLPGG